MPDPASHIDIMRTVFPVLATTPETTELARPEFFGTAFAIGAGVFTAAHVVTAALEHGQLALGGPAGKGATAGGRESSPMRNVSGSRRCASVLPCTWHDVKRVAG
jgi:hypothetical protein